jgi:hypothetical protein
LHQSFAAIQSATPAELVAFTHAALFSQTLSTLKQAFDRGYLTAFPGLNAKKLVLYLPNSIAMNKGHIDQSRKNLRSTRPAVPSLPVPGTDSPPTGATADAFPLTDDINERTHHCFAAVFEPATGQIHSDQTGKFVIASSRAGNNYVLVVQDYDINSILVEPMPSRTGPCILAAFQVVHACLVNAGLPPNSIAWTTNAPLL